MQQGMSDVARENQVMMNSLLRSELLGQPVAFATKVEWRDSGNDASVRGCHGAPTGGSGTGLGVFGGGAPLNSAPNVLRFKHQRPRLSGDSALSSSSGGGSSVSSTSSTTFGPSSPSSHRSPGSPKKSSRKIPRAPFKVLDAPALQDDYYLNLVDWSSSNVLSVALSQSVYLWSACTSKVTKLCDAGPDDIVTSINWSARGSLLAVGMNSGKVQIWDVTKQEKVRDMASHGSRVGTMAWSSTLLATGGRDRCILLQDPRVRGSSGSSTSGSMLIDESSSGDPCVVRELSAHKQEVCGLKWSFDERMLASGGNDNKLYVWSIAGGRSDHTCVQI